MLKETDDTKDALPIVGEISDPLAEAVAWEPGLPGPNIGCPFGPTPIMVCPLAPGPRPPDDIIDAPEPPEPDPGTGGALPSEVAGVTAFDGSELGPVPALLIAATLKV